MVDNMIDVSTYDISESEKIINEQKEQIATLEKTTDELNNKLNKKDAELKICYFNIALLIIVLILIIIFKIVKNIRKAN